MPVVLVLPSSSVLGSDICRAVQGDLAKLWGLLPVYYVAYLQYQSLAVPPSALVFPAEPSCL